MPEINLKNFLNFLFDIKIITMNVILILLFFSIYPNKEYTKYFSYIDIIPTDDRIDIINLEGVYNFSPLSLSLRKSLSSLKLTSLLRSLEKHSPEPLDNLSDKTVYQLFEMVGQFDFITKSTIKYTSKNEKLNKEYVMLLKQSLNQKVKGLRDKYSIDSKQSNIFYTITDYDIQKFFSEHESHYDINVTSSSKIVDNRIKIFMILTFLTIVLNILIFTLLNILQIKTN